MIIVLQIVFWLSILVFLHSYLLYPLILKVLARNKKINDIVYEKTDFLPTVSILMAVYNEEKVLGKKLQSILESDYPLEKIQLLIGSDSSTDKTHAILDDFCQKYPEIISYKVFERQGKPNIINKLEKSATSEILLFTDANVFFEKDTIYQLLKHYKNPEIGITGAQFVNYGESEKGIGGIEKNYISGESAQKYHEGIIWGTMIGAFGGCFTIRKSLFIPNPPNFIVEDFYLSMRILELGYKAILEPKAIVYEDVPNNIKDEFRRKTRISAGNFQNLFSLPNILFSSINGLSFAYWSHKVIRWIGPFLLLSMLFSGAILAVLEIENYSLILSIGIFLILFILLAEMLLTLLKINIKPIRALYYLLAMNLALFIGFFKFLFGTKANTWKPTVRNV
jgi:cellulose synthase/poly-beta-1,6-N-acetylglucosamine synthase-like glycosyltransferase